jgi:hypothetical protein
MDIQEAIEWFSFRQKMGLSDKCQDAENAALAALQEQAERGKGCDFCKIELDDYPYARAVGDNCESDERYEPVYCPKCGKRLK